VLINGKCLVYVFKMTVGWLISSQISVEFIPGYISKNNFWCVLSKLSLFCHVSARDTILVKVCIHINMHFYLCVKFALLTACRHLQTQSVHHAVVFTVRAMLAWY